MTKTGKLSKTSIAYLAFLAGEGERPQCSYGTQENILKRAGLAAAERQEGGSYRLIITDAGRAALAR